ncbi:MAG: ABC transporter substrate-binding protein, partial [Candidatus Margulisbacteria bacterium]|nr:ABC transporter substrate-binding protein [Candidatus Margulisiibacteriota bacterium]
AYLHWVNSQGGINGHPIELITYDDQYNPSVTIKNTIRLIEDDHVDLLYGYIGTPTVTRILPLLKRFQDYPMFLFFPFTGAEPHRRAPYNAFVYNLRASYFQETKALVDYFVSQKKTNIAVLYQSDAYGRNGIEGVQIALESHGLDMISDAAYYRGSDLTTSYSDQVDLFKNTSLDAIIVIGAYQASAGFIRDARNAGIQVPIANISFVGSQTLLGVLNALSAEKKMDYTQNLVFTTVVPHYNQVNLPAVKEYQRLLKAFKPDAPFGFTSFEGFLNAKILTVVLKKMSPPFRSIALQKAIESMTRYNIGLSTPVSFGKGRRQGMNAVYGFTAQNNTLVPIKEWPK